MVEQVPLDSKLHDPIQITHFIEDLSLKVHKIPDERLILNTVADEIERHAECDVSLFSVSEDGRLLRLLRSSTPFKDLGKVKRLTRLNLEKEGFDVSKSKFFNQVVSEGKVLRVGAQEILSDLISKPLSLIMSKTMGLTGKKVILAPIYRQGKAFAVLAISGDGFEERFTKSIANLSQHISYSFERVDEHISRVKAEEALRLELNKLKKYFDTMNLIILVLDSNLVVQSINRKGCELLGYSASEFVGSDFVAKLVSPNRREKVRSILQDVVSGGTTSAERYEDVVVSRDGQEYAILWCNTPITDSDGKVVGVLCSGVDVTDRKKVEDGLRKAYQNLLALTNNLPCVVYRRTNDREFRMEFISDECYSLTGYNPTDFIGNRKLSYSQIIYPQDLEFVRNKVQESLERFNQFQIEYRILTAKGELKWVMDMGRAVQTNSDGTVLVEGFISDITERIRIEEGLKRSEERFRALSDNSSDIIFLYDVKRGFEYVNPASSEVIGYSPEEFYSDKNLLFKIIYLDDSKRLTQVFEEVTEHRKPITTEIRWVHKNGSIIWTEYTVIPICNEAGELIAIEGILRNIVERRNMEAERRRFEDRLSAISFYEATLNSAQSLQQLYELTLDAIVKSLGFKYAVLMVVDKGGLKPVCQRGHSKPLPSQIPLDGSKGGLIARAMAAKKTMLAQDVWSTKGYVEIFPGIRSEICVPVIVDDKVVGALDVGDKKVNAFDEKDARLIEILASHMATAISNKEKQMEIERKSNQLASLLRNSTKMLSSTDLHHRLQVIAESIQELGWRRVVISLRDENLAIRSREDIVCAGLTPEEKDFLWRNQSPKVWKERFGPQYQRFKIGQFYYLPWSDPWVRESFEATTIPSKLASEDMVDWDPQDILYAPLTLADGKIVGIVSIDDPVDGKKPTRSSLAPLELFLTQAAVAIENAQLIQELNKATNQIKEYAVLLEQKVEQRTKELIEAQNKLIKSERFAAIGEVAAMVGHDLRNPLQVIVYTLFLANEMFKRVSPEVRKIMEQQGVIEMLERIGEQVTYMNKIVSDLQDYAKPLKPELLETSLLQVINTILATITVPENIKVNIEVTEDFPKIPMDKAMVRRVLTNLITNAIQAMPDGGELKITSSIEGDMAVISVKDTGVGMAKENIDKLFQPFYTTKSKGQGLGLAVSKRLIDAHDGFITVESEVNKGSTFTIKLPFRKLKYSQNG